MNAQFCISFLLAIMVTSAAAPGVAAVAKTFHVAPNGNNTWSGALAEPNAERTDGPFATLTRARTAVRRLREQQGGTLDQPVTVLLRGGTYSLAEPLELGPQDSGTAACPVTYAAYPNETPILSGGLAVGPWEQEEEGISVVALPGVREGKWTFRQLFFKRADRGYFERRYRPSRGPFIIGGLTDSPVWKTTMRHRQSQRDFIFRPGDIDPGWANLGDVEVVALHDWSSSRLRIESVDAQKRIVRFTGWPVYRIGHWYAHGRNPYYAENVKEAFGKPGEWYLDRPTGLLSYRPLPGEDMGTLAAVAPRTEQLVRLVGLGERVGRSDDSDMQVRVVPPAFVEHVRFRGLTFAHTAWALPAKGFSSGQGMVGLPAAVHAEFARGCRFERCTFAHLGAYALRLGQGCQDNEVIGFRMFDLGAGGVLVGITDRKAAPPVLPAGNTVGNCVISDGGLVHFSPHGVWVGITQKTTIRHCVVRRFPYSNISSGWCWDDRPSAAGGTVIENCHIHDAMRLLADGGAIYSLGWQPGSAIRGNHIHGVRRSPFAGRAPNNGIFFDQGSKAWHVADNVFHSNAQTHIRYNQCRKEMQTWGTNFYDVDPADAACPEAAKAIVAKAGLEPAYRDLEPTPPVSPIPLLSTKLPVLPPPPPPPPPKPQPVREDFETSKVGQPPQGASIVREAKGGTIRVSDETAASGKHSLKLTDASGLAKSFYPYLQYAVHLPPGPATIAFALRLEPGAHFSLDAREQQHVGGALGVAVSPDGKLHAGGRTLLAVPTGQWVRIAIAWGGKATFDVAVTLPGKEAQPFGKLPLGRKRFRRIAHVCITSGATAKTAFFIDDLEIHRASGK